ncbi:DUF3658 domain-containing protein [Nocardia sp. NBC_00511]|uniref:DUF3658 domain-containing protein n=1 Tax=Nocardia sp. NBC_00511 TaxID=2903591 RepID=UPI0030E0191D
METLHLVDGPSAAESLRVALSGIAGHENDSIAWFPDDLSIGPLTPQDPAIRAQWWRGWWEEMVIAQTGAESTHVDDLPAELTAFWEAAEQADHLVVWYGRDNAGELSLFHAVCDRLRDKPFDVIELLGAVAAYDPDKLAVHVPEARPITATERATARHTWQHLREENQTFRIVRGDLVSAPAHHYDGALLQAATADWTPIARTIAPVMAAMNVGDSPLIWRVKTLTESGRLLIDGDPWLARETSVKRPAPQPN